MSHSLTRRRFLQHSGAAAIAATAFASGAAGGEGGGAIRLGVIGPGGEANPPGSARGRRLTSIALQFPHVDVTAVCDVIPECAKETQQIVREARGHEPALYTDGPEAYKRLLDREDVDAVLITTPVQQHARQAIDAMRAGKHVGSEVPAGYTLDELYELIETKEQTGRRYMLLENYAFREFDLCIYNMLGDEALGEAYYADCGYVHAVPGLMFKPDGSPTWRHDLRTTKNGNVYATHAIGPVAKWLRILDGDRFASSMTMATHSGALREIMRQEHGDHVLDYDYTMGERYTTLIRTAKGLTIRLDYDTTSRTSHRFGGGVQCVDGWVDYHGTTISNRHRERYKHTLWRAHGEAARRTGHGGGDYFVLKEFFDALLEDREPWIDVYDGAAWSAFYDASHRSVTEGGKSIDFPDFTDGRWREPGWRPIPL